MKFREWITALNVATSQMRKAHQAGDESLFQFWVIEINIISFEDVTDASGFDSDRCPPPTTDQ